ncbi:unnamed protein product [Calypogeia fissa]
MALNRLRFNRTSATTTTTTSAIMQRIRSIPDREGIQRNRHNDAQQLLGNGGRGRGLSSGGGGEDNSDWNLEQELEQHRQQEPPQQQEQGIWNWRGDGEQRWRERRGWSNGNNYSGWEETPSSRGGGTAGGRGWWEGDRGAGGGRGEGRVSSRRGRAGRGDWDYRAKGDNDWERWPRSAEFRPRDGRFIRSHHDEERYWCSAENELPAAPHEKFVIASYNILADKNAFEHYNEMYYHIPNWLMNWDRRRATLVEELGRFSPDVMCLQEVDKYDDLHREFQRMGYRGAYKGRTGGARDGCAMFWKPTRFSLLEETSIQFNELDLRDNVAQLCVFQTIAGTEEKDLTSESQDTNGGYKRGPGSIVIIGNIHVLFNPKRGDVKLGQVRVLLESAHALSQKYGGAPVTIAGDFNSTPNSDLYKFLSTSELDISYLNRATMSGQVTAANGSPMASISPDGQGSSNDRAGGGSKHNPVKRKWHWTREELLAATGTLDCTALRHNLNLRSAYSQIKGEEGCRDAQGEPLVTTFHKKFMGTVDYIWHTEGIDTVKVLDMLPVHVLERTRGLPSKKWGSDHLALACELAFLPGVEPNMP